MKSIGNYPCLFTVEYWGGSPEELHKAKGLIYADTLVHAAEILEEYYGGVEQCEIKFCSGGIVEFDDEQFEIIKAYMEEEL